MALEKLTKISWIYDLYHLVQSSVSDKEHTDIYQEILVHIVNGFSAKSGCLALCTEKRDGLTIVAGIDLPPGVVGKFISMGEGVLGWVAQENSALLLNGSIANDPRFKHRSERADSQRPSSAICWPLKIDNNVIGAVSVNRSEGLEAFTDNDLAQGTMILNLVSLVLSNLELHLAQRRRIGELKEANRRLAEAQSQLLQSEKMASIGQLAAGVAHEINNPIGFVNSNLGSLEKYLADIFQILDAYEQAESAYTGDAGILADLRDLKRKMDIDYLKEDIPSLLSESRDGITRVKNIVQNLKDFSHVDSTDEWQWANLHQGIESTISIVWNELKYKVEIIKEFGDMPEIECLPSQLNQVFLNLLVNAGHAIKERGTITIRTGRAGDNAKIEVSDTGCGIKPEHLHRIFEPFFTTKKVGEGTGLGLSLSYGIIQKHNGKIEVSSEVGTGTTFTIYLPIKHVEQKEAVAAGTMQ